MKLTIESLKKQMAAAKYIAEDSVVVPIQRIRLNTPAPGRSYQQPAWRRGRPAPQKCQSTSRRYAGCE